MSLTTYAARQRANAVGKPVSNRTLRRHLIAGTLPGVVSEAGTWRIELEDLDRWLAQRKKR